MITLLLSVLLALLPADPPLRLSSPPTLNQFARAEFEAKVREDRYEQLYKKWLTACDPTNELSESLRSKLLQSAISVSFSRAKGDATVSRIGLKVESSLHEKFEKELEEIRRDMEHRFPTRTAIEICSELPDMATSIRKLRLAHSETFVLVQFCLSTSSAGTPEHWMLVEIIPAPSSFSIYASSVLHTALLGSGSRKMIFLKPHPEIDKLDALIAKYYEAPLKANRPPVDTGLAPLQPLPDDGLVPTDREIQLNFSMVDNVFAHNYQIECVHFDISSNLNFNPATVRILQRLPPGKLVTYEELTQICAEFCAEYRNRLKRPGQFVFTIMPHYHGKWTYADVHIRIVEEAKK